VKNKARSCLPWRSATWLLRLQITALGAIVAAGILWSGQSHAAESDPAPASCTDRVVSRIQSHYELVRDLEANFVQRVRAVSIGQGTLASPEPSRGRVVFAKPGRMRWEYETPKPSLVVTDGEQLWLYDVGAREAQRMSAVGDYLNGAAFQFLLGAQDLRKEFRVELPECETGSSELTGVVVLRLYPREASSYERLELRAQSGTGEIAGSTVVDLFGNETAIDFAEIRENVDPPLERFQFQPPPGVEVIDLGTFQ
jgi:outer membrane lipoprotein carrier protein